MKTLSSRIICLIIALCLAVSLAACEKSEPDEQAKDSPVLSACPIIKDEKYGGIYIDISPEEFENLGFEYGDSVTVAFSNGYTLKDIPYYNGYYTKFHDPLLVAYPGSQHIRATFNSGNTMWTDSGVTETDTADIIVFEKGKYYALWDGMNITYSNDRNDFPSDEVFCNFRCVGTSGVAPGMLYRSASPCSNTYGRAAYTDRLIKGVGVGFIMDLSDSDENIEGYIADSGFDSPYFLSLYKDGKVIALSMNTDYSSEDFAKKTAAGFAAMAHNDGPYLVHCVEGKDRTGFVCLLLEALMGASREELTRDYMVTYDNYYGINPESDTSRYEANKTKVDEMFEYLSENFGGGSGDLSLCAEEYLTSFGGMSADDLALLKARLSGAAG
ncbi:MAG: tyrosine-protein phosphatase [Clostridia bacterium]|nr:tyrosine-protein phosphatase [Clostridia bacterium]